MAMSKVAGDIQDLVTCEICFYDMTTRDPRMLACGHGFCLCCLQQMYDKSMADTSTDGNTKSCPKSTDDQLGEPHTTSRETDLKLAKNRAATPTISCPKCRDKTEIPGADLGSLRKYFLAGKLSGIISDIDHQDHHLCVRCRKKNDAVCYCFDCCYAMCEPCQVRHDMKQVNKSHLTVLVSRDTIQDLVCQVHGEFAEDFCRQCKVITCSECHDTLHKDHNVSTFCLRSSLPEYVTKPSEIEDQDTLKHIDEIHDNAVQHVQDQEVIIQQTVTKITNQIVDQGTNLKARLKSSLKPLQKRQQQKNKEDRERQETLTPLRSIPELSLANAAELPQTALDVEQLPQFAALDFTPSFLDMSKLSIGSLIQSGVYGVQGDGNVQFQPTKHAEYNTLSPCVVAKHNIKVSPSTRVRDILVRGTITRAKFLPNGDLICVMNNKLEAYTPTGQPSQLPFSSKSLPEQDVIDVAVHKTGAIAVLCQNINTKSTQVCQDIHYDPKNCKLVYSSTLSLIKPDKKVIHHKLDCRVYSATFMPQGSVLVLGDKSDEEQICEIQDDRLMWKEGLRISGGDHIVVSDNGNIISTCSGYVNVYTPNMELNDTLTRPSNYGPHPLGLCADSRNYIYMADKPGVCVYTEQGEYLTDVVTGIGITGNNMDVDIFQDQLLAVAYEGYEYPNTGGVAIHSNRITLFQLHV